MWDDVIVAARRAKAPKSVEMHNVMIYVVDVKDIATVQTVNKERTIFWFLCGRS